MSQPVQTGSRPTFLEELREQRFDDHRFYHQSRINQSLHFVSALCFLGAYVYLFIDPVVSVFLGWICAMGTRQSGHFFFEPRGYDKVNQTTHEHKEAIKVGYNLQRKVVLIAVWALSPLFVWAEPTLFGLLEAKPGIYGFLHNVSLVWIGIGALALLGRTLYLCLTRNVQSGLVWCSKILSDPFHDALIYHRSPLALLKGELFDPMHDVAARQ